jgi:hypothetical protein
MDATIFDRLALSAEADAIRHRMTVSALDHLAAAVEHFTLVSHRSVQEITDRLLCGYGDVITGHGHTRLLRLIVDILADDNSTTTTN